jgi:predicted pyridoxine 5'-phosphate oxidase superfamily flavin-nucleotide-binding protein
MSDFHPGELAVQERAGVRERAARVGGSIHREIPEAARVFLAQRRYLVLATGDDRGRPWASVLSGPPGFARAAGPRTIRLEGPPRPGDPLADAGEGDVVGLLAVDLATRRRMRVNGRLARAGGAVLIEADQVYANCPKYITARDAQLSPPAGVAGAIRSSGLTGAQREWIRRADTFFVASLNPGEGADASHRGGPPGFVTVTGDRLAWPDYSGNLMYNTLGNIAAHPRAGLLFPDFETGALLLLTGRAAIDWDAGRAASVPGAQRMVELEMEEVVELAAGPGAGLSGPPGPPGKEWT